MKAQIKRCKIKMHHFQKMLLISPPCMYNKMKLMLQQMFLAASILHVPRSCHKITAATKYSMFKQASKY